MSSRMAAMETCSELTQLLLGLGIDSSVPSVGHTASKVRLPLRHFDNTDLERNTPQGWVELCGRKYGKKVNACVLVADEQGIGKWRLGRVFRWDVTSSSFYVHLATEFGQLQEDSSVALPRLSVMFLAEPVDEFARRVAAAHRSRDETEAALLFRFYVTNMPTADMRTLNELQVQRLLQRTMCTTQLRAGVDIETATLIDEVVLEQRCTYSYAMNGLLLREGLMRPPLRDKVRADLLLPPPKPPVPELAVVEITDNTFEAAVASFLAISPLVLPEVVQALMRARHECLQLARLSLFNLEISRALRLEDFEHIQTQHRTRLQQFLRESWQPAIKKVVLSSMESVDRAQWEITPPAPSVHADLVGIVEETVGREIGKFVYQKPDNRKARITTQVNLMLSDAVRDMALASLHAYEAFLLEHAKHDTQVEDAQVPPYMPLFLLEVLNSSQGELFYSTTTSLFVDDPMRLLDEALAALASLKAVDIYELAITEGVLPPDLKAIDEREPVVGAMRDRLQASLGASLTALDAYLEGLRPHEELLRRDEAAHVTAFAEASADGPPSLDAIRAKVDEQKRDMASVQRTLPDEVIIGMYQVSLTSLKAGLVAKHQGCIKLLLQLVADRAREACKKIQVGFAVMHERLQEQPKDIEKLTEMTEFLAELPVKSAELQVFIDDMVAHHELLEEMQFEVPAEDFTQRWSAYHWPLKLRLKQEECDAMLQEDRNLFQKEMVSQQQQFERSLEELAYRVSNFHQYTDIARVGKVTAIVTEIQQTLVEFEAKVQTFNKRETLFGDKATEYDSLQKIVKDFEPYASLWTTASDWQGWQREWLDGSLVKLDPDEVEKNFTNAQRGVAKLVKSFKDLPGCLNIAKQLKTEMGGFAQNVPVVQALRNPGMRDRHWDALSKDLRFELRPDERFTLRDATEGLRLHETSTLEKVQKVTERAMKEFAIEKALNDMLAAWAECEFEVVPYRNTGTAVIKVTDEVNTLLDDHIVLTQQFSFSPYKGPFEERIADWERKLRLTQEVTSEWLGCQRNWMYLQPIFDSEDINRQLPQEGKRFSNVDRQWRKTIDKVTTGPHVLTFCDSEELLEQWVKANAELERVQKNLADYLETKRTAFARFYFLSNDELISILSQTKDPNAVQPHLRKCFEAVQTITMKGAECEMSDMVSAEGEHVPFMTLLYPRGSVEIWMGEIETMMRRSVRKITEDGINEYKEQKRGDFVLSHAAMVVLSATQHDWTTQVERALKEGGTEGVQAYYAVMIEQLKELSVLVRTKLKKLQSKVMSALIVMEVHARDVVEGLIKAKVKSVADFEWVSQLRYYWQERPTALGDTNLLVRQVQCTFPYGYEYLGASSRLVITPLTDRCYMTLMGAIHVRLGGAPAGPAGTGKTESVKDLAKALAKQCVVFNCSDGLDYKAMGKFFKGLCTAGAWACFDEFNRIDIEVLSVIAQQMLSIQNALITEKDEFDFEGTIVKLDRTTSTFITMNPGYAGRSELPDNLKALFRPMAMMVPDYALIAEIRLFSFGFDQSKPLAQKLVSTFRLSSEQLSSQDHYDFGMRAVNTVIQAAGILKKNEPDMQEDLQMLRAMRDSNLPKFLRDDIILFRAIIKDLFPGVKEPQAVYEQLEKKLKEAVEAKGLQTADEFMLKCIQLYEMTVVRHGMMLVGPTGGGKTQILRALQTAVSNVQDEPGFERVRVYRCNPKSITMNQLYGAFDLQTGEWTDGIGAVLIRHISQPDTEETGVKQEELKWMMFDGPVDAIWIENMNTVLDDNKKLCLNSGEIIPLSETNRVMFEVEDLAVASPATVSRCGMIYVEPMYLLPEKTAPDNAAGTPLIKTWLRGLHEVLQPHAAKLTELINLYLMQGMELLRLELSQPVATTQPNQVCGMLRMLECFLQPFLPKEGEEPDPEKQKEHAEALPPLIEPLFLLSLVWSIGATCDQASRLRFDEWMRARMKEVASKAGLHTQKGLVYDHTFDVTTASWKPWMKTVPPFEIVAKTNFQQDYNSIIVPTDASVCYASLVGTLLDGNKHILGVGPTGTGKTVTIVKKLSTGVGPRYEPIMMAFSAQTSANQTQDILDGKFEKRRQGKDKDTGLEYTMWGPMLGKAFMLFVDDFNMPKREKPLELMRQMVDHGGWYDRKTLKWKAIVDVILVGAMGPPGGGRQPVTNRQLRHMHTLSFTEMSTDEIKGIFNTIAEAFLLYMFGDEKKPLGAPIVNATVDVFSAALANLLPTPSKSHYIFNLRDVSKVIQGVLMADKRRVSEKEHLVQLWGHECLRTFSDRLVNSDDRAWLKEQIKKGMKTHFSLDYAKLVPRDAEEELLYCDFFTPGYDPSIYEEVTSQAKLADLMQEHLLEYNEQNIPMNLVLFGDAMSHICRICRVLRQPGGNALLLGVGGSGRQSLARLATHIADYKLFQIEITKNYRVVEWREDLKTVLKMAGMEFKHVAFLFTDTQIADEIFLENINNILSAGEVPNLFDDADQGTIFEKMNPLVVQAGLPVNKTNLYAMFIKMVKRHMHVILAMSPLGEEYRVRIRQFPSLINNTTISWFSPWPEEALAAVARKLMAKEAEQLFEMAAEVLDDLSFDGIVAMCSKMHRTISVKSVQYLEEMRRHNYVTPTAYLELIKMIKMVMEMRQKQVTDKRTKLTIGLDKLNTTKTEVAVLQKQLADQQPVLERTTKEVQEQQVQIAKDKEEATLVKAEAEEATASATKIGAEAKAIKEDAEADLAKALPALDAAVKCLAKLDKSQIVEVKALKKPPAGVRLTLKAVCIMFGIKSVKIPDPDNPQKKIDDYWGPSQKLLNDLGPDKFKQSLIDFDKDNIPAEVMKLIDPVCDMEEFKPEVIVKVSVACEAMCMWCHAMRTYYYVALEVEPKRQKLAKAESELAAATASREAAEAKLKAVTEKVAALEKALQEAIDKQAALEEQVERCTVQLVNADKLIGGLGGEAKAWEDTVASLTEQLNAMVGDVLVCAASISYLGPFVATYRTALVNEWLKAMDVVKMPHSKDCSLAKILADPVVVRQWNIDGLPADNFSIENGIIMTSTKRWPLMIDPQGQANRFIKTSRAKLQLKACKASDSTKKIQQTLEMCIRLGAPVLLENVLETLDPFLEPLLACQTYKDSSGSLVIKLGDNVIPYHDDFNFSLTTVIPNPHYAPEVSVKVCLLNFTITPDGLEDQLLVTTVETERADLAEKKSQLVIQSAENKRKLQELQDEILYMLSHSEGNILDDTKLIETLAVSKATSEEILKAVAEAEVAEKEIDTLSAKYIPVAVRGSLLFFAISDLALVDPMYQYSLIWFKDLFVKGCVAAEKSDDIEMRVVNLNDFITYSLYVNVCRSIFESHKLMFSFLLAIKIKMGKNEVDIAEWRFLLAGGKLAGGAPKPDAEWLEEGVWIEFLNLAQLPKFAGIEEHVAKNLDVWRKVYDDPSPQTATLPGSWGDKLNMIQKLLVLRCLRPDKCVPAVQSFVEAEIGRPFIEPPPFDLHAAFSDSSVNLPLIFILSVGADPVKGLLTYAEASGMSSRLDYISLGQGQGPKAERLIREGKEQGRWVLLMNCHLYVSWMNQLEKEVEDIDPGKADPSFRLWLTSMPSPKFPVSVLQNGVKMTNEPPAGLRANLRTAYSALPAESFESSNKPDVWRKIMFGILLFNAVILERRKFGALGWNIQYSFTDSDRDVSLQQVEQLVSDYEVVPFKVVTELTAEVNYGGRVTDNWDRRTIKNILYDFVNADVLRDGYGFSPSGFYKTIEQAVELNGDACKAAYLQYIQELPTNASPEIFGLHDNADITCAQNDTYTMFTTILSLQPRAASGGGTSREEMLDESAAEILGKVPPPFNLEAVQDKYPTAYEESMNTVVQQECIRYNKVIRQILRSLKDIRKALKGEVVMTAELEEMGTQLFNNQVPEMWAKVAYPSLKPLGSWVPDLEQRLNFLQTWLDNAKPPAFWISGFFFPQAFLTGTMQNHARKYQLPIDTVSFGYQLTHDQPADVTQSPTDGVLIFGMFLEGARINPETHLLEESRSKELFTSMPMMHLLPVDHRVQPETGIYITPVYKTLARFGTLSTTGHSTNFVMACELAADRPQQHWTKRGVAAFLSLKV